MNITIIGAGNMGRGIGTRAVAGGHSVTFVDANPETAQKAAEDVKASAKNGATSTISIVNGVRAALPGIKANLPPSLKIVALNDQSVFVKAAKKLTVISQPADDSLVGELVARGITPRSARKLVGLHERPRIEANGPAITMGDVFEGAPSHVAGRALAAERLPHALVFQGPEGVGKATAARVLAAALLCEEAAPDRRPCATCAACRKVAHRNHPDFMSVERLPKKPAKEAAADDDPADDDSGSSRELRSFIVVDQVREMVAVVSDPTRPGLAAVQAWWVNRDGTVEASNTVRLRRSATWRATTKRRLP